MDTITLATTALTLASPFLSKIGEGLSIKIGEDVWNVIKKPFTKEKSEILKHNPDELKSELINKLQADPEFEKELKNLIEKSQKELSNYTQQNISNNGRIEKQVNIGAVNGNINL